jgi:hypothetical protein
MCHQRLAYHMRTRDSAFSHTQATATVDPTAQEEERDDDDDGFVF